MLSLSCLFFAVRGYQDQREALQGIDFKAVYGASRCMAEHCNPYDSTQTKLRYIEAGGRKEDVTPFSAHYLGYPPSALFYAMPLAVLSWQVGYGIWMIVNISIFIVGAFLVADLCLPFSPLATIASMSVFIMTSLMLIMLGQPAASSIGLCCIGVWCLLRNRYVFAGVVCFAMSLVIKPHLGGLVLLYFFLASVSHRKRALQILVAAVVLALPGLIWASVRPESRNWLADLKTNVSGVASHGDLSDPGPMNPQVSDLTSLQTIVSLFRDDKAFYNHVSWVISGVLLLVWAYPVIRLKHGLGKDFLCLAAIAPLAMLPIYHRGYDTRLLLLTFPALSLLLASKRFVGFVALAVSLLTTVFTFTQLRNVHIVRRVLSHVTASTNIVSVVLLERPLPIACLVATLFYLVCCYLALWNEHPRRELSSIAS
jgi:hypothetical protein